MNITVTMTEEEYEAYRNYHSYVKAFAKPSGAKPYDIKMDYDDNRLTMTLLRGEHQICSAHSWIKDDTELALVQAISYAAHMLYKFAEQAEMEDM